MLGDVHGASKVPQTCDLLDNNLFGTPPGVLRVEDVQPKAKVTLTKLM